MDLSGRKILVVEDVRFTRTTIVRMLNQMGCQTILEAEDGAVALALLAAHGATIDAVLTDLDMPNVNGEQLLGAVRGGTDGVPRNLKMVALTGHTELDHLGPVLLLDIDAVVAKPTSKQALESCFARLFAVEVEEPSPRTGSVHDTINTGQQGVGEYQVALSAVPANSCLSRDLLFPNGRLLLRAGTALSDRLIARLRELTGIAGLSDNIWIADPAA